MKCWWIPRPRKVILRKQSWTQVVDSTVVLTTDHSGLHNNLVHMHRPPRHPGGAISTLAYPTQCQLWSLKWYTTLAPAPRAFSPNCPGAQSDTGPVQPISAPEVSSLTYFGSCSDVGSWSNSVTWLHHSKPWSRSNLATQGPGESHAHGCLHGSPPLKWPHDAYKPLSAAAQGQSRPSNLMGDSEVCASAWRPSDRRQLEILRRPCDVVLALLSCSLEPIWPN